MPKYSLYIKNSKEEVTTKDASTLEEAKGIFAKIKVLSLEKFNKLYEVAKR